MTLSCIREEVKKMQQQYNHLLAESGYELIYRNRPYDQEKQAIAFAANWEPDVKAAADSELLFSLSCCWCLPLI